jgi:hypothetical protein
MATPIGLASSTIDNSGYDQYGVPKPKSPSWFGSSGSYSTLGQNNSFSNKVDNSNPTAASTTNFNNTPTDGATIDSINQQFQGLKSGVPGLGGGSNDGIMGNLSSWFGKQNNMNMMQAGLGIGQMGLGLASYLDQSKYLKKQGTLLDQQIGNNTYEMNQRKRMNNALDAAHV